MSFKLIFGLLVVVLLNIAELKRILSQGQSRKLVRRRLVAMEEFDT